MSERKRLITPLKAVAIAGILLAGGFYYVLSQFADAMGSTTDPNRYESKLKIFKDAFAKHPPDVDFLAWFPKSIPPQASHVQFYYESPPGDAHLELRCALPASEVSTLVARVAPVAKITASGSDALKGADGFDNSTMLSVWFKTGDVPNTTKLSTDFTIYLIGVAHGDKTDSEESPWTYEYGIAVNPHNNEVIYWFDAFA